MIIKRFLHDKIKNDLTSTSQNKIIILYGARQVGKTTLITSILAELHFKILIINADELKYHDILSSRDSGRLGLLVNGYELIFIDEAQRIPDIGINLKILHERFPHLKIIVTGSSSLDLADRTKEPLTGRTLTYTLYPIAFLDLAGQYTSFELEQNFSQYLIYGQYPELLSIYNREDKYRRLKELTSAYLYKDVLELTSLRQTATINKLLKLLAFQIGSEVSLSEIGSQVGLSKNTVSTYLDLLEQSFVIFRLSGFSRNLRKEITKMDKIYFYDLGIRNSIIDNLNMPEDRNDIGSLWENFLISERKKLLTYTFSMAGTYFWRTYTGAELDYIEDHSGKLSGFEFKWGKKKPKAPESWIKTYPESSYTCISQENFLDFILLDK